MLTLNGSIRYPLHPCCCHHAGQTEHQELFPRKLESCKNVVQPSDEPLDPVCDGWGSRLVIQAFMTLPCG